MAQVGQPIKGQPKKFNWKGLIIGILLVGGLGVFAWWLFFGFGSRENVKTLSDFDKQVKLANVSQTDNVFFKAVKVNYQTNKIYVNYKSSTGVEQYVVYGANTFEDAYGANSGANSDTFYGKQKALSGRTESGKFGVAMTKKSHSSLIISIVIGLLPVLLLVGAMVWLAKKQGALGDGGIMGSNKSVARKVQSKKRFSDIAGQEEVKEEVKEVVDFLKNPKKYKAAGARIPKGILLGGPPGTGKTLIAKATAGEAAVPFYFISASNFVEMFAGLGAKRVRTMFIEARKNAPAILFIDELDAIARKRGSSLSGNDEREQTLNQILVEMDGMDENGGLLILAATNRLDVLDPAILRPGRFDRTITVNNPDVKEREAILKLHAKGKRIDSKVDFANIARRVPGYSGAQLENIVNEAALLSVREDTGVITLPQIDEAIDRVVAGPAKKNRVISKEELEMVAYHEAGHAVIGLKVDSSQVVQKITIIPRGNAGGYNLMTPKKETYNHKKSELEAMVMSYMGGRAAEQIIYGVGEVSTGASNDIETATNIVRAMVTQYGMSDLGPIAYEKATGSQFLGPNGMQKDYSESMSEKIDDAVRKIIIKAETKAIAVIKKNKLLLKLIKEELLEKETIVLEEIQYINKNLKRLPVKKTTKKKKPSKDLKDIIKEVNHEKNNKKDAK